MKTIEIGVIGLGTIGTGVVKILRDNREIIEGRVGTKIMVSKIADLDTTTDRGISLDPSILTTNAMDIVNDPRISVVVELIGGEEPAATYLLEAIAKGKHVVTANKALLSARGAEIFQASFDRKVDIGFEGSVCGGIPVIQAIKDGFSANRITLLFGILNGTANYILTKMTDEGRTFQEVLQEAQELGYAEADPALDVNGTDSAHKLSILLSLIYGKQFTASEIHTEGITTITPLDIEFAQELGYRIKLLALFKDDQGAIEARVHPTLIPQDSLLAHVKGVYNAAFICGDAVGPTMFYGRGAGMMPTGSAVVSDIIHICRNILKGSHDQVVPIVTRNDRQLRLKSTNLVKTKYYLRFSAQDRPGVLSQISGILGKYSISIASVIQKGREVFGAVPIFMLTHEAVEENMKGALKEIDALPVTSAKTMVLRIEDEFDALI
ncbi:MAG: homoserine dehydrogenase [Deltaproteobacteria bacterium]|nr:homoserine dehydrogenase [Deltaproteobacteria bacterium]